MTWLEELPQSESTNDFVPWGGIPRWTCIHRPPEPRTPMGSSTIQRPAGAGRCLPSKVQLIPHQLGRHHMKAVVIGESSGASREAIMAVYPRHKAVVDKFV